MVAPCIEIQFDGGDADRNQIDMKYYALALQGAEDIISDGLIMLINQRLPKPRERAPILLKAKETRAGSHITPTDLSEIYTALELGVPIINAIGADYIYEWFKAVISYFSGKPSDMDAALARMVEMNRDHLAARDRQNERVEAARQRTEDHAHEERMLTLEILRDAVKAKAASAEKYASPVGEERSVRSSALVTGPGRRVPLSEEGAEEIRAHNRLEWEKIAPLRLTTDGFKFHTSALSVQNPESDGYLMATVKDPAFAEEVNVSLRQQGGGTLS